MAVKNPKNPILKSICGRRLGLDNDAVFPQQVLSYLVGLGLAGIRTFRVGFDFKAGNDYRIGDPSRHSTMIEDFLGLNASPFVSLLHGSDGSAAAALNPADGGQAKLTTGAGATHTSAVNGAQVVGGLNWVAGNDGLIAEFRVGKISALTGQSIFIGFCDVTTLSQPFTLAAGTLTNNAQNGVGFLQDSAGTNTHLNIVSANTNVAGAIQALTNDIDTAAYHLYRVEITKTGDANLFIDGVQVGVTQVGAVLATASMAPTVAILSNVTTGSQNIAVDSIYTQQIRV